jgi:hypothetical protein
MQTPDCNRGQVQRAEIPRGIDGEEKGRQLTPRKMVDSVFVSITHLEIPQGIVQTPFPDCKGLEAGETESIQC